MSSYDPFELRYAIIMVSLTLLSQKSLGSRTINPISKYQTRITHPNLGRSRPPPPSNCAAMFIAIYLGYTYDQDTFNPWHPGSEHTAYPTPDARSIWFPQSGVTCDQLSQSSWHEESTSQYSKAQSCVSAIDGLIQGAAHKYFLQCQFLP